MGQETLIDPSIVWIVLGTIKRWSGKALAAYQHTRMIPSPPCELKAIYTATGREGNDCALLAQDGRASSWFKKSSRSREVLGAACQRSIIFPTTVSGTFYYFMSFEICSITYGSVSQMAEID